MKQNETTQSFDVIIIGGGATGAGTARDCFSQGYKDTSIGKIRHLYRCYGEKSRFIA